MTYKRNTAEKLTDWVLIPFLVVIVCVVFGVALQFLLGNFDGTVTVYEDGEVKFEQQVTDLEIETINTYELNGEIYDCIHYTNGGMDCTLGSDPDVGGGWMPPEELP